MGLGIALNVFSLYSFYSFSFRWERTKTRRGGHADSFLCVPHAVDTDSIDCVLRPGHPSGVKFSCKCGREAK